MIQWLWAMSWRIRPRVPESNEDRWSMVTTTTNCIKGVHTLLFEWHTQWQLRKAFNKQYKQQISCTKISFNIPSNINKQTTNNIMQDHAKQRYIFGHLSLIQSLALDIPSGVTTVRDLDKKCPSQQNFPNLRGVLKKLAIATPISLSQVRETSKKSVPQKRDLDTF